MNSDLFKFQILSLICEFIIYLLISRYITDKIIGDFNCMFFSKICSKLAYIKFNLKRFVSTLSDLFKF
jgi:hypothetical protein